ncbi:hypothetical protein O3M35_010147 [Rhynocoris fuscipes]|uniref:YEATS domain-containing protein n=1 Tax=Rhynocoris fuscipes TaxID=488301 RepID=A0AAW1CZA9_9HEMI
MRTPGKEENECEEASPKRIKLDNAHSVRANLSQILEREIRNEINVRRNDLDIIEQRIFQTRQSLVKIRQGVVAEYYKVNSKGILQMPPHPAVKDTFHGKCPAKKSNVCTDDETIKEENPNIVVSENDAAERDDKTTSAINDGCEIKDFTEDKQFKKLPRYIPPKYRDKDVVQLFEPRGNVKKQKFRLSIVNVSKWIFNKEDGAATHKWTIYVKNSDPSTDISLFVAKVTFFLHHSYKPNDVISVEYPPFKLTRRGWGEFPLRIQLNFKNDLDKPVDVIHQLKLDTTHSGLDTFGNETVVDVWAHINEKDLDDSNETVIENCAIKQEEEEEDKKALKSPKTEPDTLSSVKSSACISDEYLSTSSLSQLSLQSLATEISTDFLSDLFQENEPKQNKEQIEMLKAEIENDCINRQNDLVKVENFDNCDYTELIENISSELIFDGITGQQQTSSVTSNSDEQTLTNCSANITSELNFDKISTEQQSNDSNQINKNETGEDFPIDIFNSTQDLTKIEDISNENSEQTTNFINNDVTSTSLIADTYNPIECLNFVNDEVIIESEHEQDDNNIKINENSSKDNNLTCKNYLENFVDTEILSNNEETIKTDLIPSNHNYIIEVPKISQQIRIAPGISEVQTLNISNSPLKLTTANQIPINESLNKSLQVDNKVPICVNIYDNLNIIKSKTNTKKLFIEDINNIRKMKISPVKNNQLNQVMLNKKISNNGNLLENRNEAIILVKNSELNKNSAVKLSNNLSVSNAASLPNSSQVTIAELNRLTANDNLKQKLFIEMPDGKLREICSVKPANDSIKTKPIIIESSSIKKRRNPPLEIPIKQKETNLMKKTLLINNSGIKIIPSVINQTKFQLNGGQINQLQNTKRLIVPIMKTVQQKTNQSILKPNAVIASGSNKSTIVMSTNNQTNLKLINKSNLINENIIIQRKVLPGESLLKKGNQIQGQEVVTVAPSQHQIQTGNTVFQHAPVSTVSAELRNNGCVLKK